MSKEDRLDYVSSTSFWRKRNNLVLILVFFNDYRALNSARADSCLGMTLKPDVAFAHRFYKVQRRFAKREAGEGGRQKKKKKTSSQEAAEV